jgi:hypothetical protein
LVNFDKCFFVGRIAEEDKGMQMSDVPYCVRLLSALLVPTIAIAGIVLGILNHRLARKRRKDELFDRRYEFYRRARDFWLSTANPASPPPDIQDWISVAGEASFLFGRDIAEHLVSLDGKRHDGSPFFPNDDFVRPFRRYLTLA